MTDHHPNPNHEVLMGLAAEIDQDPLALLLALALAMITGSDGWARITQAELAATLGIHPRTLERKLVELKKQGLVEDPAGRRGRLRLRGGQGANPAQDRTNPAQGRTNPAQDRVSAPIPAQYRVSDPSPAQDRVTPAQDRVSSQKGETLIPAQDRVTSLPATTQKIRSKDLKDKDIAPSNFSSPENSKEVEQEVLALTPAPDPTPPPVPVQPKPSRKRPTAPLPEDWQPAPETIATLINLGFDPAAIEAEAGPFKIYWRERGERRAVWQAGFINWMKNQRKWEQRDAQRTEQQARFTDASGRPISEREATRQARIERLLEPFDGEIDLDMRI